MAELDKIGKYRIVKMLGKGAMGVVYQGVDPVIERTVAIKTIHKTLLAGEGGQELLARFKREAQAAGKLQHPNIVAIYEYGEEQGTPFIAMEFIQGRELKDLIKANVQFSLEQIVEMISKVLVGLQYCHAQGVIHRDLKPANIILLDSGQVKIADFGIARMESSTMTVMGSVMGTPNYMSPEQFMGQRVDARADLFSIGVILYELLTGQRPFQGAAVGLIMQKVLSAQPEEPTRLNPKLPEAFNALIKKALAKRPADRFQNAMEFNDALRRAAALPVPTRPAATPPPDEEEQETMLETQTLPTSPTLREPRRAPPASREGVSAPAAESPYGFSLWDAVKRRRVYFIMLLLVLVTGTSAIFWLNRAKNDGKAGLPERPYSVRDEAATPPAEEAKAAIFIVSQPAGALVLLDGRFSGVTPTRVETTAGNHHLVLVKEGLPDMSADVTLAAGESLEWSRTMPGHVPTPAKPVKPVVKPAKTN